MERELKVGDSIIYIDAHREPHPALVTKVWGAMGGSTLPGCNLVIVSSDETKTDPYGTQLERFTSVVHKSANPAGAWCWHWADEA